MSFRCLQLLDCTIDVSWTAPPLPSPPPPSPPSPTLPTHQHASSLSVMCRCNQRHNSIVCISPCYHSPLQLAGAVCDIRLPGAVVVHVLDSPGQGGTPCSAVPPWGGYQGGGGCALGEVCTQHCCLGHLCCSMHPRYDKHSLLQQPLAQPSNSEMAQLPPQC